MEDQPSPHVGLDPDRTLLQEVLSAPSGDLRAFEALVSKYQKQVIANCRYLTAEANSAEDLAQEVFVKIYFGLRRFEGRSLFRTWVQSIKVKHCLTHMKKERKQRLVGIEEELIQQSPQLSTPPEIQRLLDQQSDREVIGSILEQIPEVLRVALILRDMDGFSYEQVAETLGISLSAAKMRITRGRQEFRARYETLLNAQTRTVHA